MAGEVQESLWRLNADVSDAVDALRTLIGEFQALNATVDRIDRALDDVNGHLDKAGQAHERFGSRVGLANQALVQFAATMTGTLAGLAGFAILREVQQGLEGLVGGVVKTNAQFESWRVTMGAIIDGMGRTSDAERDLTRRTEEASAQFSTKWREAEEKRADAAEKYARRREELERHLDELDGRAAAEHQRKFVQAEAERDHAHSQTILHLQQREDDLNAQFADRVQ